MLHEGRAEPLPFALPSIGPAEIEAVVEALESGWLTTGPRTAMFESEFAAVVGAPAALALSSGTAALHLGLLATGVGPGHAVITTPLTFCSTVHVIEHVGAHPVLVDVLPDSLNIDPEQVATAARDDARPAGAVLPVHLAGAPADMMDIERVARASGAAIVEDAAHAQGAVERGRPVGAVNEGDLRRAVAFSFYATKNITTGEGGMLTGSVDVVEEARRWSLHGMSRDAWKRHGTGGRWAYDVTRPGFKYNLTDLQSALGLVQLKRSAELLERRATIAQLYDDAFEDLPAIRRPWRPADGGHAWHLYVIRLDPARTGTTRDDVVAALAKRAIGTSVHFIPIHRLQYYREKYAYRAGQFPRAEEAFEQMVSLPIYPAMKDEDAQHVIEAVRAVVDRDA